VRQLSAATVGFCLIVSSGCALSPPRVGGPAPAVSDSVAESEYQRTLERYSGKSELYALFDTRMFVSATYQGWEFRDARVKRVGVFKVLPPEVIEANLATERAESEQFHDFFLAVHLNDSKYDDFDRKDTIWRIALVADGMEATPSLVRRVGRSDLNMRAMYPYADEFWVGYQVRFPKSAMSFTPGNRFLLRVASTLGKAELEFRP
jgi:hypothetical protein